MVGWNTATIVNAVREICPQVVPRFVLITFSVSPSVAQTTIDRAVGDVSFEWYRYAWNCYFSWTPLHTGTICSHIRKVPGLERAYVVVSAVREEDAHANLSYSMWDWLKDKV